jgi:hypothetical protein
VLWVGAVAGTGAGTAVVVGMGNWIVLGAGRLAPPKLVLGVLWGSCAVAESPVTMANMAPADSTDAAVFDRRAGDGRLWRSVIGLMFGLALR